ncbi:SDR family NAD(P)-dependent oxidoreductase [Herbiconiux sp. P17]|uniref:SDR family NAD(P)-dependent oxidoreductase n=1 Tax=Herbiconiux wuyangfengii TaxID=3342794 RepID=UPI0035B6FB88
MTQRLLGKTALVTGSTNNIGLSIAKALAAEGAHVAVSGRDAARGAAAAAAIRDAGGRADFVRADLDGSSARSQALATDALAALDGRIDILVNNAGIYPPHSTASADDELFDRIYAVNLKAPFFLTQAVVPGMIAAGGGVVVNLGSWITRLAVASSPLYSSSKSAMETLTRSWAAEFGPQGVRVNAVSPGVIRALDLAPDADAPSEYLMHGTPAGRTGFPHEIAAAVAYLASDDASFVHGTTLDVDGGRVAAAVVRAA